MADTLTETQSTSSRANSDSTAGEPPPGLLLAEHSLAEQVEVRPAFQRSQPAPERPRSSRVDKRPRLVPEPGAHERDDGKGATCGARSSQAEHGPVGDGQAVHRPSRDGAKLGRRRRRVHGAQHPVGQGKDQAGTRWRWPVGGAAGVVDVAPKARRAARARSASSAARLTERDMSSSSHGTTVLSSVPTARRY